MGVDEILDLTISNHIQLVVKIRAAENAGLQCPDLTVSCKSSRGQEIFLRSVKKFVFRRGGGACKVLKLSLCTFIFSNKY